MTSKGPRTTRPCFHSDGLQSTESMPHCACLSSSKRHIVGDSATGLTSIYSIRSDLHYNRGKLRRILLWCILLIQVLFSQLTPMCSLHGYIAHLASTAGMSARVSALEIVCVTLTLSLQFQLTYICFSSERHDFRFPSMYMDGTGSSLPRMT